MNEIEWQLKFPAEMNKVLCYVIMLLLVMVWNETQDNIDANCLLWNDFLKFQQN